MIVGWPYAVIALVALERVAEVVRARRNTAVLLARGGRESGARHYPLFVLLHASWLAALVAFARPDALPGWQWLILFALLQLGRLWVIATLGPYWTTRIITVPGAAPVTDGPYRYLRHPNYLIVAIEIPALSLALGEPGVALVFGTLNLALLAYRIRIENAARAAIASG
jgi:methyltransferase